MKNIFERIRFLWYRFKDRNASDYRRTVSAYKREKTRFVVTDFPNLTTSSVAFDLGGYRGDWAAKIFAKYGCQIHVFEAHPEFAAKIASRFAGNHRISVHPFALASTDGYFQLSSEKDASSSRKLGKEAIECRKTAASRFFAEQCIDKIDVMKINIEGAEYDILTDLIASGKVEQIDMLLIQFHNFDKNDPSSRAVIRKDLSRTHHCDWCYDFVWEQWSIKPPERC